MAKQFQTEKKSTATDVSVESDKSLKEVTGAEDRNLQSRLINQVYDTLCLPKGMDEIRRKQYIDSIIPILQGIKPTDEVEGMMATQMVATHNVVMDCLGRAMIPEQSLQGWDMNLKHATKLLSIFSRQIEVLDKHRGKGHQKITVERVNVESGGQAIVGHVEAGKAEGAPDKGW